MALLMCSGYPRFIRGICYKTPNFWVCTDLKEEEGEAEEEEGGEEEEGEEEEEGVQELRHGLGTIHPVNL